MSRSFRPPQTGGPSRRASALEPDRDDALLDPALDLGLPVGGLDSPTAPLTPMALDAGFWSWLLDDDVAPSEDDPMQTSRGTAEQVAGELYGPAASPPARPTAPPEEILIEAQRDQIMTTANNKKVTIGNNQTVAPVRR